MDASFWNGLGGTAIRNLVFLLAKDSSMLGDWFIYVNKKKEYSIFEFMTFVISSKHLQKLWLMNESLS